MHTIIAFTIQHCTLRCSSDTPGPELFSQYGSGFQQWPKRVHFLARICWRLLNSSLRSVLQTVRQSFQAHLSRNALLPSAFVEIGTVAVVNRLLNILNINIITEATRHGAFNGYLKPKT